MDYMRYTEDISSAELIKLAMDGKHSPRELIQNMDALKAAHALYKAIMTLVDNFDKMSRKMFTAYLDSIINNQPTVDLLAQKRILDKCYDFYYEELQNLVYMMKEYDAYLAAGHMIQAMVYRQNRPEEDMHDFLNNVN